MSPRFWMVCAGVATCGALAGFGLGGFAGGKYSGGLWQDVAASSYAAEPEDNPDFLFGGAPVEAVQEPTTATMPVPIICKGCGPTLAERGMSADAYMTAANDPTLRDYEADERAMTEAVEGAPPAVVATAKPHPPPADGGPLLPGT